MFLEWNSSWFSYGKQEAAAKNVRKIRCSKVLLNQLLIWVFWQQKRCSIIIVFVLSISKWCWSLIFRFWRAALTCRNFSKSNYWSSYIVMCVLKRPIYFCGKQHSQQPAFNSDEQRCPAKCPRKGLLFAGLLFVVLLAESAFVKKTQQTPCYYKSFEVLNHCERLLHSMYSYRAIGAASAVSRKRGEG